MNVQPAYGELTFGDSIHFTCGKELPCFLACCTGVKPWLFPYDVLRIRRTLGVSSGEFLRSHVQILSDDSPGYPALHLKAADEGKGRCFFAGEEGCAIYPDRPWVCRLFPIVPVECCTDQVADADRRFNVLVWEECRGIGCGPEVTVSEWWRQAGISAYEENYLDWQQLLEDLKSSGRLPLTGEAEEQFILGSYDPDRFREKLLAGEFRDALPLDEHELRLAASDDRFLLKLSCRWMNRALLG